MNLSAVTASSVRQAIRESDLEELRDRDCRLLKLAIAEGLLAVTPQMIDAGKSVLYDLDGEASEARMAETVFLAMLAAWAPQS